jgi:integrase/recombinase XerD
MARIKLQQGNTVANIFAEFISAKRAKGLVNKTIHSYVNHFQAVSRHLNVEQDIVNLCKSDLDKMVASMRDAGLSPNSINSYTKMLKSFLSWCNREGITSLNIPIYRGEETVKDTYTDKELEVLLKKPDIHKCSFSEYRDWVIINFLLNSGSRASTVRAIQIRDVDLNNGIIHYRHNKNHRAQIVPLCGAMIRILREYLRFRGGEECDALFCTETGTPMSEGCLRSAIVRYNTARGIQKTSLHMFRHTFSRKYLLDCGGDAFTLQKILGHSTLDMTKHYCAVFNVDIVRNFDNVSPLEQMRRRDETISLRRR